ncbi:NAD(P)/FAD-dependent oxidoreductase [Palleronia pelagia]|uniref:3-phenylpropionate/trans-cinnamate dioxygenase ferredoxin reductase subunit n=1 Tax=Palleronia pelagia TaxID=387096 RepID=A0A1H8EQ44_9RHOB|nr:FAD/NAD(P)-binding oxidoreductase [Palleronia pelagia]SEN21639.1 3-phenylpropionate/trans-cinnamate dioxygenase ferredoxin reductase subunit [Palleronia pelagia]
MTHIVVIGAGQAASSLIGTLRAKGFGGAITLVGAEPVPPYQRPPLSKGYLLGDVARDRLFLRPASWWDDHDVTLKLGTPASDIDTAARTVRVGDETLSYDQLAICTGLVPRALPADLGGVLDGVHTVRSLADVDAMADPLKAARRLLVVGGGYIGLEAAAVARKLGVEVTLVEAAPRILSRVAADETAAYFRDLHRGHGVHLVEGASLARLEGEARVTGAVLADGRRIDCDIAIVGIGLLPRCAIAEAAGLDVDGGVAVDDRGRTSDPRIWAAGDCAALPLPGGRMRIESVGNAIDMGAAVAANMLGADAAYDPKPWFWSDQYDVKLQIAGLNTGHDRVVVRPGARDGEGSHWYFAGDRLLAVDAMNDARAYMIGKRLIEAGRSADPETLADPAADLKALLRA